MPDPSELNPSQLQYVTDQINAQPGFTYMHANVTGTNKLHADFGSPTGAQMWSQSPGSHKDWLTDDVQFKAVVSDLIDYITKHFS